MRAIKLWTGEDNASHVLEGTLTLDRRTDVAAVHFKESPPHSSFDWHDAPERQYVITLAGTLEFITRDGEKFIIRPGDVLDHHEQKTQGSIAFARRQMRTPQNSG
jgi:hypothetical protein